MNHELAISSEIVPLPQVKTVAFEDLNIDYVDTGSLGLEDAAVRLSRNTTSDGITEYQAEFDIQLGPKKLRSLLTHASPPPARMLRRLDDFSNFASPHAMQNMYETMVLSGKPIERGHQLADLEALRKRAVPVLKADPLEPEDLIDLPLTPLYTLDQIHLDLLEQKSLPPRMLKQLLFSNTDPHYRLRLLRHVGLKPKYETERQTKKKLFNPNQQKRGILGRFERSPQRLSHLLEIFPDQDINHILEEYAFLNFGGYIAENEEQRTIVFDVGQRQEIDETSGELQFSMGNLDITARIETTLSTHGKSAVVIPTSATLRKYLQAGVSWTKDTLQNREWDFEAPFPTHTDPILGLTLLSYIQPTILDRWHPNHDLLTPSFAPARAAIEQKNMLEHPFLSASEAVFR